MKERARESTGACAALPEEAEAYVQAITGRLGVGRRIAEEVRRELIRHFEDALDGVSDPRQRTAVARDVVEGFGDEELLSRLIRRGKLRAGKGLPSTTVGGGHRGWDHPLCYRRGVEILPSSSMHRVSCSAWASFWV